MADKNMKITIGHLYPDLFKSVWRQRQYCLYDAAMQMARDRCRNNRIQYRG